MGMNMEYEQEIAESDLRVALIGELIKARKEKGISQKSSVMKQGMPVSMTELFAFMF